MMCTTMLSLLCARDSACNISSVFTLCGALPEYFPQTVKQMKPTRHGVLDPLSSGHAENAARHVIKYDCKLGVGPDYAAKLPFLQRMLSFSLSRLCIALTASLPPSNSLSNSSPPPTRRDRLLSRNRFDRHFKQLPPPPPPSRREAPPFRAGKSEVSPVSQYC